MTSTEKPKAFGTGLIALDLVMGIEPESPVQSWAGGTCGNVLSILAYLGWDAFPIARMNGDPASERVRADMGRWGVRLDYASCSPTSHTPIIIQQIRRGRDGSPIHRFSWSCPRCGEWLPSFKAVTVAAVEKVSTALGGSSVFFMDRLSRASLTLAAQAAEAGAVVVFEPSGRSEDRLFAEAIRIAHIVKYADQRLAAVGGVMEAGSATLLEVQTLGVKGLRYRHRLGRVASGWKHLDSVPAPRLADTCGSGDWCTAGLVSKLAMGGLESFRAGGASAFEGALRYGQTLAAWNCGFEGARGGMYAVDHATFEKQIASLMAGRFQLIDTTPVGAAREDVVTCPACPAEPSPPARSSLPRKKRASVG